MISKANSRQDHEEHQTDGAFGQQVGHMEQGERGKAEDHFADDHEGAVLSKLAIGLVNHEVFDHLFIIYKTVDF